MKEIGLSPFDKKECESTEMLLTHFFTFKRKAFKACAQ